MKCKSNVSRKKNWMIEWVRHHVTHFFLFGISVLQVAFLFLFTRYCYETYLLDDYAGEALNHDTIYFYIEDVESIDLSEVAQGEIICNATLLRHMPGTNYNYEVLYSQGKKDIFCGEYFEGFDFVTGDAAAVVGNKVTEGNETKHQIEVEGYTYPIIEIMRETLFTTKNNAIFYTNADLAYVPTDLIFAITSESEKAITNSFENIKNWLNDKGIQIKQIHMQVLDASSFIDYHTGLLVGFVGYLLLLCVVNGLLLFYWYYQQENWLRVMKLLGVSCVKLKLLGRFLRIQLLGIVGGLLGHLLVTEPIHLHGETVVAGMIFICLIELFGVILFGIKELIDVVKGGNGNE